MNGLAASRSVAGMAMTTSNSMSVKPGCAPRAAFWVNRFFTAMLKGLGRFAWIGCDLVQHLPVRVNVLH